MVTARVRKIVAGLKKKETAPAIPGRFLIVISFMYDKVFVLEGEQPIHIAGHSFLTEALIVFRQVFGWVLAEETTAEKAFQRDNVEWHPIIMRLEPWLQEDLLDDANLEGLIKTRLEEHRFYEELSVYFSK